MTCWFKLGKYYLRQVQLQPDAGEWPHGASLCAGLGFETLLTRVVRGLTRGEFCRVHFVTGITVMMFDRNRSGTSTHRQPVLRALQLRLISENPK
jgi:hypothetical protein